MKIYQTKNCKKTEKVWSGERKIAHSEKMKQMWHKEGQPQDGFEVYFV